MPNVDGVQRDQDATAEANPPITPAEINWRSLALIFATALVLRGIVLLELSQTPFFSSVIGDGLGYHLWAKRIAAGDWAGGGVFYQAPLYPYLVGVLYSITSVNPLWVKLSQVVLEAFSCVLLASAGARFSGSEKVGVFTGVLASLYAPAIFFTTLVQKATLGFFFTALVLNLLSRLYQNIRSPRLLLLLGISLGLLALTRENALIFIFLIVPWLAVKYHEVPARTLATWIALFLLGASIPLVTVGVRNYVVGGDFTLTTSQFGTNFFIGNNANSKGFYLPLRLLRGNVNYERDDAVALAEESTGRKLSPDEVSEFWTGKALRYIQENPFDWLGLMVRKSLLVWNRVEASDTEYIAAYRHFSILLDALGHVFHFGIMVPLAAAGIWLTRRRWREFGILYAMMAAYAVSLTLFFLFARYRIPLVPPILIFAAIGINALRELIRGSDRRTQLQTALVIACASITSNLTLTDTNTQHATTYKNFGTIMIEKEDFSKAVEYFEKSLSFRSDCAESLRGIAESLADLGRFEESQNHFERLVELEPDNFFANLGLGRLLLLKGRFQNGIAKLIMAAQLEPGMTQPHHFLAIHFEERGQLVRARAAYLEILEREEAHLHARVGVTRIERKIERRQENRNQTRSR